LLSVVEPKLPPVNILFSSGGKFYALLPNTEEAVKGLQGLQNKVEGWLHNRLNAEVVLNIAYIKKSDEDLQEFGKVMFELSNELRKKKLCTFSSVLKESGWKVDRFLLKGYGEGERPCRSCEKLPAKEQEENEREICVFCKQDRDVGGELVKEETRFINILRGKEEQLKAGWKLWDDLVVEVADRPRGEFSFAMRFIEEENEETPVLLRRIANYVPRGGKGVLDFEDISDASEGRKAVAYLKADVDHLGKIFAFGLPQGNRSMSRIATLSRMLDLFFCGWIQQMLSGEIDNKEGDEEYKNIYTVFSGGDDLLLVGPWNDIINFIIKLNEKFRLYTCKNPAITLSGGVVLAHPKTPVSFMAEEAEEALEMSKNGGRNRVTLFGETLEWDKAENAIDKGEELAKWIENGSVSHGFVYNLLTYAQLYKGYYLSERESEKVQRINTRVWDEIKKDEKLKKQFGKIGILQTECLKWLPLMTYDIARNLPASDEPKKKEVHDWAEQLKCNMENEEIEPSEILVMVNYALNRTRGERGSEEE
ncbi:MAG: type III-A CRISPR-associated protein Cas10/Csm1, partial [Planctomycetota bacterium]|nr:type III-A CRISPR-associated protein Cas10/Csm1 [Planctomycetota bacterium]